MDYLFEAIQPTRLYIKQCPHCGLKYFGKTTRQDIENYPGSGTRWTGHLKKHGVEPIHLWNSDWYYDTSISRFALKFSRLNKIVESKQWANLAEENGLNGGPHFKGKLHSPETRRKISHTGIGKTPSQESKDKNSISNKKFNSKNPELRKLISGKGGKKTAEYYKKNPEARQKRIEKMKEAWVIRKAKQNETP